jgi:hypothetical protein
VVLAAFVVTLLGGLAVKYGVHRFVAAYLLNAWFIIALGLPTLIAYDLPTVFRSGLIHTEPWKQALAWLLGSAVWIVGTFIVWLAGGRKGVPQPVAEIPGDISPRPLTRPVILFAVIRAVAVSAAVAIAFGLQLPNAYWMPVAAIIAMKPDLQQTTFVAEQRLVEGRPVGGYTDAFELICCDCGDDPDRAYRELPPRLQLVRGPYPIAAGVAAYQRHSRLHQELRVTLRHPQEPAS